jgi:hypothetical protein
MEGTLHAAIYIKARSLSTLCLPPFSLAFRCPLLCTLLSLPLPLCLWLEPHKIAFKFQQNLSALQQNLKCARREKSDAENSFEL